LSAHEQVSFADQSPLGLLGCRFDEEHDSPFIY
jgi:hypothetical protein